MAFGQPSGPPASTKQVQHLLSLLQSAGHSDFRDARGPLGFTQRQAAGKFTRDEAAAFIERLEAEADHAHPGRTLGDTAPPPPSPRASSQRSLSTMEHALRKVPSAALAAELQRRGWVVMEP